MPAWPGYVVRMILDVQFWRRGDTCGLCSVPDGFDKVAVGSATLRTGGTFNLASTLSSSPADDGCKEAPSSVGIARMRSLMELTDSASNRTSSFNSLHADRVCSVVG